MFGSHIEPWVVVVSVSFPVVICAEPVGDRLCNQIQHVGIIKGMRDPFHARVALCAEHITHPHQCGQRQFVQGRYWRCVQQCSKRVNAAGSMGEIRSLGVLGCRTRHRRSRQTAQARVAQHVQRLRDAVLIRRGEGSGVTFETMRRNIDVAAVLERNLGV